MCVQNVGSVRAACALSVYVVCVQRVMYAHNVCANYVCVV